jgi:hypothetical protein
MYRKCREDIKSGFKRLNKLPYKKRSLFTAMGARSLHNHAMHYGPAHQPRCGLSLHFYMPTSYIRRKLEDLITLTYQIRTD